MLTHCRWKRKVTLKCLYSTQRCFSLKVFRILLTVSQGRRWREWDMLMMSSSHVTDSSGETLATWSSRWKPGGSSGRLPVVPKLLAHIFSPPTSCSSAAEAQPARKGSLWLTFGREGNSGNKGLFLYAEVALREEGCSRTVLAQCDISTATRGKESFVSGSRKQATDSRSASGVFSARFLPVQKQGGAFRVEAYHSRAHTQPRVQIQQQSVSMLSFTCNWSKKIRAILDFVCVCFFKRVSYTTESAC